MIPPVDIASMPRFGKRWAIVGRPCGTFRRDANAVCGSAGGVDGEREPGTPEAVVWGSHAIGEKRKISGVRGQSPW